MTASIELHFLPSFPTDPQTTGTVTLMAWGPLGNSSIAVFCQLYRGTRLYAEQHASDAQTPLFCVAHPGTYTAVMWTEGGAPIRSNPITVPKGMLALPYPKQGGSPMVSPRLPWLRRWFQRIPEQSC